MEAPKQKDTIETKIPQYSTLVYNWAIKAQTEHIWFIMKGNIYKIK
jgi:hypothetical protein